MANPTRNWTVRFGYPYSDRQRANYFLEREPCYSNFKAFVDGKAPGRALRTANGTTIGEEIDQIDEEYEFFQSQQAQSFASRPHKANVTTKYAFDRGGLKGAFAGGSYRFQSKNYMQSDRTAPADVAADDHADVLTQSSRLMTSLLRFSRPALLMVFAAIAGAGRISAANTLPRLDATFETAYARSAGDVLTVGTGGVERRWRWTGHGLVTIGFDDTQAGRAWATRAPAFAADWSAPGWIGADEPATLITLSAARDDDQRFTTPHLRVAAEVAYPKINVVVRYVIWAYPGASGVRTQLWVKGAGAPSASAVEKRSDYLPIALRDGRPRAIGYYNDTQNRNRPDTPILREEVLSSGTVDWASIVALEDPRGGVMMVKESHKCVNQPGVDTGLFAIDGEGFANTGWSFGPDEGRMDEFLWCWATWTIAFRGGGDERELALKRFDRLRFPTSAQRDLWMVACTWGHSKNPRDGRNYAHEKEVLPEMKSVADLGIDMLLIDDGWQVSSTAKSANPTGGPDAWKPHPEVYSEGWKNVAALQRELGLRLGLWGVAQGITSEQMVWNWEQIRMQQFKLDFARLQTHRALDEMMDKVRGFMRRTKQSCIISWDVTENAPRYGYYWAREYGNVHFMNRKPETPANVVYVPWLALRDFWNLSKYNNLNKWQLVTCIPSNVNRAVSDAWRHSVSYCAATTFMGIPEFMATTRSYTAEERAELTPLLARYKTVRREIFDRIVFPIGREPSNASWTGFQAHDAQRRDGCLLILREIGSGEREQKLALRFLAGTRIEVEDVRTGRNERKVVGPRGEVEFVIERPADFLLLRYAAVP